MNFFTRQKNSGFTLIEFQLYLFLLVVMMILLSGVGIHVLESRSKAHTLEEIHYSVQFIFEKLDITVREAVAITQPTPGETSNLLSLEMADPAKNPTSFEIIDGAVILTQGVEEPVTISTDSIEVTEFSFINTSLSEQARAVRVVLGVDGYGEGVYRPVETTYNFYTSLTLHNRYEI